jgi:hypothetical protein
MEIDGTYMYTYEIFIEITELRLLKAPFDWISDFEEHTLNDKIPSGNLLHSYW